VDPVQDPTMEELKRAIAAVEWQLFKGHREGEVVKRVSVVSGAAAQVARAELLAPVAAWAKAAVPSGAVVAD
jgi:hypothetical protein